MLAPVRRSIHYGALEEHGVPPGEHPCEYGGPIPNFGRTLRAAINAADFRYRLNSTVVPNTHTKAQTAAVRAAPATLAHARRGPSSHSPGSWGLLVPVGIGLAMDVPGHWAGRAKAAPGGLAAECRQ